MSKRCTLMVLGLTAVVLGGAYKFMIQGSTVPAEDGRTQIVLTPGERDMILAEMRTFLESIQGITAALAQGDLAEAARIARTVGSAAQQGMPGTLIGKLPMEFKQLGFDTHSRFDQFAMDAEAFGEVNHALEQLADLMRNCVACHATFRLEAESR